MNRESITTRKAQVPAQPGDFCFDDEHRHIYVCLPGRTAPDAIPIQKGAPGGTRIWGWDGNTETPTLTPSIEDKGHWHGFLRAGKLESC